ncbi:PaaI family thioesterase [uncultured Hymenobacter sp.]|uniref:PaaI family thioesterase n=1 Tax=uncultured Hymenobacter sp. TaxID=170016 RepID=UPI0035CA0BCD
MPAPDWAALVAAYNRINHYGQANGMALSVPAPGQAEYRMQIRPDHLSSPGTAHGGVVAGLMDAALGAAALTLAFTSGEFVSTVEFKLNYLHPVRLAEQLVARAQVEHTGNRLIVSSAVIFRIESDGPEMAVARGLGTFNRYPADKREFGQLLMG